MSPTGTTVEPVFATHAPSMRRAGFAVLPARGKEPILKGYRKWRYAPALKTVQSWAEKDPDADIVYVPGLSRAKAGGSGIVVVDADDELACERVVELFGCTPGKVRTRRGRHYLYRGPRFDFRKVSSLKALGVNADVKHGNSIVVAPWSRHEKDPAFIYTWEGCDETVIRELPPFNGAALQRLIENSTPRRARPSEGRAEGYVGSILRDGSRKLELNDRLVPIVWSVSSEAELLECAFKINEKIGQGDPRGPLALEEVETARSVWRDREIGKIEQWIGVKGKSKRRRIEFNLLNSIDPKAAPLAWVLLERLRDEHSARCRLGETFALDVKAMARAQTIPGWSWRQYDRARKLLLKVGLIEMVSEFTQTADGRVAAHYKLSASTLWGWGQLPLY
jgi:Bifunctional DNA primase/polymerase, N-terminal